MPQLMPLEVYKTIIKYAPIVSNDILIEYAGKYLLLKRKNEPLKGLWWTPGGRLQKNEHIIDAVHRVIKEELGIKKIKIKKFFGVFEFFCQPGKFGQKDIFYISFAFLVEPLEDFKIKLDSQHSEYKFFTKPLQNSHPFIKRLFYLANKRNFSVVLPTSYQIKE